MNMMCQSWLMVEKQGGGGTGSNAGSGAGAALDLAGIDDDWAFSCHC